MSDKTLEYNSWEFYKNYRNVKAHIFYTEKNLFCFARTGLSSLFKYATNFPKIPKLR